MSTTTVTCLNLPRFPLAVVDLNVPYSPETHLRPEPRDDVPSTCPPTDNSVALRLNLPLLLALTLAPTPTTNRPLPYVRDEPPALRRRRREIRGPATNCPMPAAHVPDEIDQRRVVKPVLYSGHVVSATFKPGNAKSCTNLVWLLGFPILISMTAYCIAGSWLSYQQHPRSERPNLLTTLQCIRPSLQAAECPQPCVRVLALLNMGQVDVLEDYQVVVSSSAAKSADVSTGPAGHDPTPTTRRLQRVDPKSTTNHLRPLAHLHTPTIPHLLAPIHDRTPTTRRPRRNTPNI
ncbi:hypothetical protein K438DRAFT_1990731 [Mycena galopus ATCC 62051]|nr:hypothetical protein K438DRAFT_1990731 [Mycena galopus ATCC 62051]